MDERGGFKNVSGEVKQMTMWIRKLKGLLQTNLRGTPQTYPVVHHYLPSRCNQLPRKKVWCGKMITRQVNAGIKSWSDQTARRCPAMLHLQYALLIRRSFGVCPLLHGSTRCCSIQSVCVGIFGVVERRTPSSVAPVCKSILILSNGATTVLAVTAPTPPATILLLQNVMCTHAAFGKRVDAL